MTMSVPSQASLFADLSTSSRADSPASRSASPGSRRAPKTSGTSGLISHDSSEKSDPVGYWLRTYLASELSRLTSCLKTWKDRGTPAGRSWWVLTTLERPTEGSGSGLWPTATAGNAGMSGSAGYSTASGRHAGTTLTDAASGLWASPQSRDWKDSGPTQGNRKSPNLGTQASWPTAKASDWKDGRRGNDPRHGRQLGEEAAACAGLPDQASPSTHGKRRDWPAPQARAQTDTPGERRRNTPCLETAAVLEWPTPRANRHGAPDSHGKSPIRGALSPAWVTQMMGYPDGWLDTPPPTAAKPSKHLETRSSRKSSRSSAAPSSNATEGE